MKWSEQMRVLNSEDEHYNQLIFDVSEGMLYINDVYVADVQDSILSYYNYKDLIKKYPFFNDKNFLLKCLFKSKTNNGYTLEKTKSVSIKQFNGKLVAEILSVTPDRSLMIELE